MARKKKKSLIEKILIFSIVSLAVFGGCELYQENLNTVNKIKNFANEINIVVNEMNFERK